MHLEIVFKYTKNAVKIAFQVRNHFMLVYNNLT